MESYRSVVSTPKKAKKTPEKAKTFHSPNEGASPQSFHDDTETWQASSPKEGATNDPLTPSGGDWVGSNHRQIVQGSLERATNPNQTSFHECPLCYATFSQKTQLSQHISLLHCGLVPHSCNFCEAKFVQKHHLKAHIEGMYIK